MYKILRKEVLAPDIYLIDIEAPRVAKSAKPGQFIIVMADEKSERIPLTICDYDAEKGSVTIVFQKIGGSTIEMTKYEVGDYFRDFVGPLGQASEFINEDIGKLKNKKFLFIAGGVGSAPIYPQVKWFAENKIDVDVILGSKSKSNLILEKEISKLAGEVFVATDDGSYGFHGLVTDLFKDLVDNRGKKYDHVVAIGPMVMMKFAALATKEYDIPTTVSLNPIMVDGTGMCGACRVSIGDEVKFACVDGPEFDGHLVNFDEAMRRQRMYKTEEGKAQLKEEEGDTHHHGGCGCGGDH